MNEDAKIKLNKEIEKLSQKIINIENGCAKEIVMKLKTLRNEVALKVEGNKSM